VTPTIDAGRSEDHDAGPLAGPVHFIGIGGSGMSGIARVLRARGVQVSGSDVKESRALTALRALGAEIYVGHAASNIDGAATVVVSTAIRDTNPEVVAARDRGIPVLRRAEALAGVMVGRRGIAVAGTHGKTTTTSMVTVALQHCGADPSFAIGSDLSATGVNAHDGSGPDFVAEADESDESFLLLAPQVAIITNVEADHLDHFSGIDQIMGAFAAFVDRLPSGGVLVACADDEGSARIALDARARGVDVMTYGTATDADLVLHDLRLDGRGGSADLVLRGVRVGTLTLQVPGEHNLRNAAAAFLAAHAVGYPAGPVLEGLTTFTGARRRFEPKGSVGGIDIYDDYAHHPTEVRATIQAAREVAGGGRVVAVLQVHRYSRAASFLQEFGDALAEADEVVVMEPYDPGEVPIPGAGGQAMAATVPLPPDKVEYVASWSDVPDAVVARLQPGDLLLTMGAGEVAFVGGEVLLRLQVRSSA
jgi:UDP-N-acetylmuramate--alanine ligase